MFGILCKRLQFFVKVEAPRVTIIKSGPGFMPVFIIDLMRTGIHCITMIFRYDNQIKYKTIIPNKVKYGLLELSRSNNSELVYVMMQI